jgi:GT2 family glycosyltransferase
MEVSIVITNWNGKKLLEECLPSIYDAVKNDKDRDYEVIIVDDCSQDDSVDYIKNNFPSFKVIIPNHNLGFQRATNFGVLNADGEIVILLNNDIKVRRDSFPPLFNYFQSNDVFAVGGRIYQFDEKSYLAGKYGAFFKRGHFSIFTKKESNKSCYIPFVCGGAGAFHREKFIQLGGFDDLFHPLYYEDVDICYRAWKRGWKCIYEPKSLMYHKHQATIKTQVKKVRCLSARNNYLFVWKNITDFPFIIKHLLFAPLFLIRDIFKLNFRFWISIFMAFKRLKKALKGRRVEKKECIFSDKVVFSWINKDVEEDL